MRVVINKTNTTIIFINQLREKIGVMFGNPETTTGGRALKFFSSMRMDVRRVESIKSGDRYPWEQNKGKNREEQGGASVQTGRIRHNVRRRYFESPGDVLDCAVEAKVINKAGSWYSFGDNRIGQGRENIKKYLEENPDVLSQVEEMLLETLKEKKDGNKEDIKPVKEQEPDMSMFDDDEIMIDEDGVIIE